MNFSTLDEIINKPICKRCENIGYYEVGVSQSPQKLQMFCACPAGRNLRKLTMEFRLNDLKIVSDHVLPKLREAKKQLHKPNEASKIIDEIIKAFEELEKKTEESFEI